MLAHRSGGAVVVSADTKSVIERAKRIYADQLSTVLESQHMNRFVAIEPESGEYFLADTFDEAVKAATRGVNCLACSHPHFSRLVAQEQPPAHEEEQEPVMSAGVVSLAQAV